MSESNGTIAILTGNHLCNNPRVIKEAATLAAAGYCVKVLGAWLDPVLKVRDRALAESAKYEFFPVFDATLGGVDSFVPRVRNKLGSFAYRSLKRENAWQLGYAYSRLRKQALREEADIYIAHSEQAMAVGAELLWHGRRVGVDMEDWFSQDLPADARRNRPEQLLAGLERTLLTAGAPRFCTSLAMGAALAGAYDCAPLAVVYNAFPYVERETIDRRQKDRRSNERPSIHWYSQTLGPGRGLEVLFAALRHVRQDAEIHLRGTFAKGFQDWLRANTPQAWRERIFIHQPVNNDELLSRIAEHDIGFAGEIPCCRSRDLTITNKILHYLLGGLAVVASDTAGQREAAQQARGTVVLYPPEDSHALAAHLDALLQSRERLAAAKSAALDAARETFCWEKQESVLLEAVAAALSKKTAARP